jgi:hypothetical protein
MWQEARRERWIEVGGMHWVRDHRDRWIGDEDNAALATEAAMLDKIERLQAELDVERTANRITENHNHFDCAAELSRLRCENERLAGGPS